MGDLFFCFNVCDVRTKKPLVSAGLDQLQDPGWKGTEVAVVKLVFCPRLAQDLNLSSGFSSCF